MDVEDLAPALLGVASLCKRANDILNRGATAVTVTAQSDFKRGSFGIDLDLVQVARNAYDLTSLLSPTDIKSASEIAAIVGLIVVGDEKAFTSLLDLFKWLRGQKAEKIEKTKDNTYEFTNPSGDTIIVQGDVHNLFMNPEVRQAAHQALKPLDKPGIDKFLVRSDEATVDNELTDEVMPFFELEDGLPPEDAEEVLSEGTSERTYVVIKPSFNPKLTWRLSDGRHEFDAHMDDKTYAQDAANGKAAFVANTMITATIKIASYRSAKGKLRTEYKILKVSSTWRPSDIQQSSLLPDDQ